LLYATRMQTKLSRVFLFTLVASAAACAGDDPGDPDKIDPTTEDPFDMTSIDPVDLSGLDTSERLGDVADDLTVAMATDADLSNVFVDPDTNTVTIYRVGGETTAARTSAAAVTAQGATVKVLPALVAAIEADAFSDQLETDLPALATAGVELTSWGPDSEGGPFEIAVAGDPAQAQQILAARYPALAPRIAVVQMDAAIPAASRNNDTAPYWGGARIHIPGGAQCTSGWGVHGARDFLITASHCVNPNDDRMFTGANNLIGHVGTIHKKRWDVAFIRTNSAPDIYVDKLGATSSGKIVVGVHSPADGSNVCLSGSFEQRRCGIRIKGKRRLPFGNTTVDVWVAHSKTGAVIVGQGDSGGPAFATRGGNPVARGLISMERTGSSIRACPSNSEAASQRLCSNTAYITDMGTLAKHDNLKFANF
jgi:hypothetical protein